MFVFYFYSYTPVYECVSSFLNKAEEQEGKVAAIMSLGAAKDLTIHYQPSGYTHTHTHTKLDQRRFYPKKTKADQSFW